MALSVNEIELVLRFQVGPNGAGEDHKYMAKYASADCECPLGQAPKQDTVYDFPIEGPATDVKFVVRDRAFYTNKGVLSAVSPVFCAMFNGEFREKYLDQVPLEGVDPATFEQFLEAVYSYGKHPTVDNFADLMELADRFDVKPLRKMCEYLCRHSVVVPFGERLQFAVRYGLSELEDELVNSVDGAEMQRIVSQENLSQLSHECLQKLLTNRFAALSGCTFIPVVYPRDNSDRDAVFTLIDQLLPPDGSQPAPEVSVPCVYRLGPKNTDGRPRLLKVVFATRSMQRSVLSAAKFLRGLPDYADVYVRPSLTTEERLREYNLRKECRARRELGEKVRVRNGAIVASEN